MSRHIELEVSEFARDYAETLTPDHRVALIRLDVLPPDPAIAPPAFNVAEFKIEDLLYGHSQPGTPYLVVYEEPHAPLGSEEAQTNAHYHVFMQITGTIAALRAAIKRTWTGNAGYSLKQGKPELIPQQFNYLCKGTGTGTEDGPAIIYRSDEVSDDVITECHTLFWKNNDAIQAQKVKKHPKVSISETIFQRCLEANTGSNKRKIGAVVAAYFRNNKRYQLNTYCRTLVFQTACWMEPAGYDAETFMNFITSNPCL